MSGETREARESIPAHGSAAGKSARESAPRQQPLEVESSRLLGYLARVGRLYPGIWKRVDERRAQRRRHDPSWPEWCFLPFRGVCEIVATGDYLGADQKSNISSLAGLMAWRATQGLYHFDPTVFDALWDTPLEGDIPSEVLYRLPEWCVYVSTGRRPWLCEILHGFFAYLDLAATDGRPEVRFLLDFGEGHPHPTLPVDLTKSALAEAVESTRARYLAALARSPEAARACGEDMAVFAAADLHEYTRSLTSLMNLVLYLCSANADLRDHSGRREKPQQPSMTRTRKGLRLFPPEQPTNWEVGWRLGAALRGTAGEERRRGQGGTHASPRPHIRRAHWHSYWTGPKAVPSERSIQVKWIPPVGVNVGADRGIVPVVRRLDPAKPAGRGSNLS